MSDFLDTSAYIALWICPSCRGEYSHPIRERNVGDDNCPYCNNRKVLAGFNSLADIDKELTQEWSPNNYKQPSEFLCSSSFSALWICPSCRGEYSYPIRERNVGDNNCPYCDNKKVLPGYNSFKQKYPKLMEEWDNINNYLLCNADEILDSYSENVWWICKNCKKNYYMSPKRKIYFQKRHMKSCPYCKGLRRKKKYFF